jgi:hypothetical protein
MSWQHWEGAETKILAGVSRIMGPAKLNEMVQYCDVIYHPIAFFELNLKM